MTRHVLERVTTIPCHEECKVDSRFDVHIVGSSPVANKRMFDFHEDNL